MNKPRRSEAARRQLELNRLREVTIAAPVAFVLLLEAFATLALRSWVPSTGLRLLLIFGILVFAAVPFAMWIFSVIERQRAGLAQSAELLDTVTEAIFMLDPNGTVMTWNRGATQVHGYEASQIVGQQFDIFYPPSDIAAGVPRKNLDEAEEHDHIAYEGWRLRKDGTEFWASVDIVAVRDPLGELTGFCKVTRDMTERREAEHQIRRLNSELEKRVSELAEANVEVERRAQQLEAANAAITAISSDLDLSGVLQRIVDSARNLVSARYGALGVSNEAGTIQQFITSGITPAERESIGPLPQGHGLLGALIEEAVPLRLADIQNDPRSSGFPPNHPPMKSLLGVPILYHGKAVGNLYMTEKVNSPGFTEEDQSLLTLLASHAAVAITNSGLFKEVWDARNRLADWSQELEEKVAERTRQIESQSRELTRRVIQAQEDERKRIARELHDETAQSLSTLLINVDLIELGLPPDTTELRSSLDRLRTLAKRALDETRALSHDLRPTILDDVGLAAAIQWFADEWARTYSGVVEVSVEDADSRRLDGDTELALFRITQEALTNAGKYAQAQRVAVDLSFTQGSACLRIVDDGKGFDPEAVRRPSRHGGLGLFGMRERTELIGGALTIHSAPSAGTSITVTAPLQTHGEEKTGPPSRDTLSTKDTMQC